MQNITGQMRDLQIEIDAFLEKYRGRITPTSFPFQEYKTLNQRLFDVYEKMGINDSAIHPKERDEWFLKQAKRLTQFLPD